MKFLEHISLIFHIEIIIFKLIIFLLSLEERIIGALKTLGTWTEITGLYTYHHNLWPIFVKKDSED